MAKKAGRGRPRPRASKRERPTPPNRWPQPHRGRPFGWSKQATVLGVAALVTALTVGLGATLSGGSDRTATGPLDRTRRRRARNESAPGYGGLDQPRLHGRRHLVQRGRTTGVPHPRSSRGLRPRPTNHVAARNRGRRPERRAQGGQRRLRTGRVVLLLASY